MKTTNEMVLFWGGPFSQWFRQSFVVDGVEYSCAEQYMMAKKAELFGDTDALTRIMRSKDPRDQKAIGRTVKNFDASKWESICREVVYTANKAKFGNNPYMAKLLLDTGDREIVEASPYDRIWGIGLSVDNPDALDKSKWQGANWLGEALMRVREELKNEG